MKTTIIHDGATTYDNLDYGDAFSYGDGIYIKAIDFFNQGEKNKIGVCLEDGVVCHFAGIERVFHLADAEFYG